MMKIIIRSGSHDDPTAPPGGGPERDPRGTRARPERHRIAPGRPPPARARPRPPRRNLERHLIVRSPQHRERRRNEKTEQEVRMGAPLSHESAGPVSSSFDPMAPISSG